MPARKIPKNCRNASTAHVVNVSAGPAQFESSLEHDFLTLLEFHPEVERYEVQPMTIAWDATDGKERKHTPDILVLFKKEFNETPWLCEVKYRSEIFSKWREYKPKFKAGVRFAKNIGWRYRLITEVEIRTPHLINCRFLKDFKSQRPHQENISRLLNRLSHLGQSTPAALISALEIDPEKQADLTSALWYLIANHRIDADLYAHLTMESPIWSAS